MRWPRKELRVEQWIPRSMEVNNLCETWSSGEADELWKCRSFDLIILSLQFYFLEWSYNVCNWPKKIHCGKKYWLENNILVTCKRGFPGGSVDIRDTHLIPGWGRCSGGRHGKPPQYSCLENPMDWGGWQPTVYRVSQSQTQLKWLSTHTDSTYKKWIIA